jgi:hypothetical protein
MMITVTADDVNQFSQLLKHEEFPREALKYAELDDKGRLRIVMRSAGSSRSFVATLQLTTLEEI